MKRMLTLIAGGRGDAHHAVFHDLAEGQARAAPTGRFRRLPRVGS